MTVKDIVLDGVVVGALVTDPLDNRFDAYVGNLFVGCVSTERAAEKLVLCNLRPELCVRELVTQ
jgi:hypothetical protein